MYKSVVLNLFYLLISISVGLMSLSLFHPIGFPKSIRKGGEFKHYKDYQKFATNQRFDNLSTIRMVDQGYWLWSNRIAFVMNGLFGKGSQDAAFNKAAFINTKNLDTSKYANLPQRQAYYRWAHSYFESLGSELQWMKAADKTIGTLALATPKLVGWLGYSNAEIRTFIFKGNKLILDDMIPRINDLVHNTALDKQLTQKEAFFWDAQTLADEQTLIQPLYKALSTESLSILENNLNTTYGVKVNLLNVSERWAFGMHVMGYLGTTPKMMPEPGGCWNRLNFSTPIYDK